VTQDISRFSWEPNVHCPSRSEAVTVNVHCPSRSEAVTVVIVCVVDTIGSAAPSAGLFDNLRRFGGTCYSYLQVRRVKLKCTLEQVMKAVR
jgi:hypothetical protein